jgi:hypothetical protein
MGQIEGELGGAALLAEAQVEVAEGEVVVEEEVEEEVVEVGEGAEVDD